MKKAIVLGTFDLTHYGHFRKFKKLKEMGYYTIAGVTTSEFAEMYKRKPILNLRERLENLQHCRWVDFVCVLATPYDHTFEVLETKASVVVHSKDWTNAGYAKQTGVSEKWLKENGVKRLILPYTKGVSTTEIIERCKQWG